MEGGKVSVSSFSFRFRANGKLARGHEQPARRIEADRIGTLEGGWYYSVLKSKSFSNRSSYLFRYRIK